MCASSSRSTFSPALLYCEPLSSTEGFKGSSCLCLDSPTQHSSLPRQRSQLSLVNTLIIFLKIKYRTNISSFEPHSSAFWLSASPSLCFSLCISPSLPLILLSLSLFSLLKYIKLKSHKESFLPLIAISNVSFPVHS